jgi:hypothetical protein
MGVTWIVLSEFRDFSHEILFAGEDIHKKIVQSKVELKITGLGQNQKYFWGKLAQFL